MTARAWAHALVLIGLSLGITAFPGAAYALDKCICIVSNKLRGDATPVKFQYRTCLEDGSCNAWKARSFQVLSGPYTAKVICSVNDRFSLFRVRFDAKYRSGVQLETLDLHRFKTFTLARDEIPKCGCMRHAQYHFVKARRGVELRDGPPRDMKRGPCKYDKL